MCKSHPITRFIKREIHASCTDFRNKSVTIDKRYNETEQYCTCGYESRQIFHATINMYVAAKYEHAITEALLRLYGTL